jgi:hypothetical protein
MTKSQSHFIPSADSCLTQHHEVGEIELQCFDNMMLIKNDKNFNSSITMVVSTVTFFDCFEKRWCSCRVANLRTHLDRCFVKDFMEAIMPLQSKNNE